MNELLAGEPTTPHWSDGLSHRCGYGCVLHVARSATLARRETIVISVWFEGHNQALVVSPGLPANTASKQSVDMHWLVKQVDT